MMKLENHVVNWDDSFLVSLSSLSSAQFPLSLLHHCKLAHQPQSVFCAVPSLFAASLQARSSASVSLQRSALSLCCITASSLISLSLSSAQCPLSLLHHCKLPHQP